MEDLFSTFGIPFSDFLHANVGTIIIFCLAALVVGVWRLEKRLAEVEKRWAEFNAARQAEYAAQAKTIELLHTELKRLDQIQRESTKRLHERIDEQGADIDLLQSVHIKEGVLSYAEMKRKILAEIARNPPEQTYGQVVSEQ